METLERWLRNIWQHPVMREWVLLVGSTIALQLVIVLGDLLKVLETSVSPFQDVSAWLVSAGGAIFITVFKQTIVWLITKLGKVATSGRPGSRATGEPATQALGLEPPKP